MPLAHPWTRMGPASGEWRRAAAALTVRRSAAAAADGLPVEGAGAAGLVAGRRPGVATVVAGEARAFEGAGTTGGRPGAVLDRSHGHRGVAARSASAHGSEARTADAGLAAHTRLAPRTRHAARPGRGSLASHARVRIDHCLAAAGGDDRGSDEGSRLSHVRSHSTRRGRRSALVDRLE